MMELNSQNIEKIFKEGLSIDAFTYLLLVRNGEVEKFKPFFNGLPISLINRGCIDPSGKLTPKGEGILNIIAGKKVTKKSNNYDTIFVALQEEIERLTGKKQKTDKIHGKSYSFLPNMVDFNDRFHKVVTKYKIDDLVKAEKVLINYINKCNKANNWFPVLEYYLFKDNQSRFATDYLNFNDTSSGSSKIYTQDSINFGI